jgi:hypothetical protein
VHIPLADDVRGDEERLEGQVEEPREGLEPGQVDERLDPRGRLRGEAVEILPEGRVAHVDLDRTEAQAEGVLGPLDEDVGAETAIGLIRGAWWATPKRW